MEFVRTKNESDQFTAMTTLSSKRFYVQICKLQISYVFCFCKYCVMHNTGSCTVQKVLGDYITSKECCFGF